MNRRSFFRRVSAVVAGWTLAPYADVAIPQLAPSNGHLFNDLNRVTLAYCDYPKVIDDLFIKTMPFEQLLRAKHDLTFHGPPIEPVFLYEPQEKP